MQSVFLLMGISKQDFYSLTFDEAADVMKTDRRRNARNTYDSAMLTSQFILLKYAGKQVPPIEKVYDGIFEPKSDLEAFREFAIQHNLSRKK